MQAKIEQLQHNTKVLEVRTDEWSVCEMPHTTKAVICSFLRVGVDLRSAVTTLSVW